MLDETNVEPIAPLKVTARTNEDGSPFEPAMMGSGEFAGAFPLEHAPAQYPRDCVSVRDALAAIGYAGEHRKAHAVGAYFEAHIEQGPVLEAHDKVIDVMPGALGQRWCDVTLHGTKAHAGSTPMALPRYALIVAEYPIQSVNRIALDRARHGRLPRGCVRTRATSCRAL
ncbi:hypothetical protein LJ655_16065 [Paraburkholderia sp. MMS20-SJTN17]|uniref:Uncharacterized protein n=1 Tax=Paraburkholderia translucens TaxID=2886945 RepID=A0ABS8KF38_9BURK|nr:hypothetical protein [Paraburkholderia sp. MMS20-SJTN17]MCC8403385.1 hypothetical protein [Paraburkholderia sp. MMS20-SJTN17]